MTWGKDNNVAIFFFEAFDEPWKGDPDNASGAEKHWGIFFVDRTPKEVMQEP
jgi:exo-beta-1,3-glucanase (GH17 family)